MDDITDRESLSEEPYTIESSDFKLCAQCQLSIRRRWLDEDGLCPDCQ